MALRKRPGGEMNFEGSLQKLESIVKRLEEEEIPLETSLKLFAEGQTLARACEEQLRAAENQIRQLLETPSGKILEEDFETELAGNTGHSAGETAGEDEEAEEDEADEAEEADKTEAGKLDTNRKASAQESASAEVPPVKEERRPERKKRKDPNPPDQALDELPF
jgi:exodeoxyribonuclease VII small subunit